MTAEIAVSFALHGETRIGILHLPAAQTRCGVLIVVGGWQYRVGSHRQFVQLGRALASAGVAVFRFDSRGMGDSDGEPGEPEPAEHLGPEICAALDAFAEHSAGVRDFILCGLCDGASAALIYAPGDPRVKRLMLLNPWLGSPQGAAQAMLRHHYRRRLRSPDFWRKLARGGLDLAGSARSLSATLRAARGRKREGVDQALPDPVAEAGARIDRAMAQSLDRFAGRILLVLSGQDRTAAQYADLVASSPRWQALFHNGRATRLDLPEADHTFSRREQHDSLVRSMLDWLCSG